MFTTGTKFSVLLFFTFSLFLACQCYDVSLLELQECQAKCSEKHYNTTEVHICVKVCNEKYIQDRLARVSPDKKYEQCQQKCQLIGKEVEKRRTCQQQCKEDFSREKGREGGGSEHGGEGNLLGKKKEKEKRENPYFFEKQRFESEFKTEEGHFRVLQRFSEKSELLNGIDNYRLAIFEANPRTLLLPHHCDGDAIYVVTKGQAFITIVNQKRRVSFYFQRGDAIKVPAGATVYLINHDNNEKVQIVTFVHPLNTPGHFVQFFGAGGEDPQSFYGVFSKKYIRAALNVTEDKLDGFFQKQKGGKVIKLSQEEIRALTQDQEGGSSSQGQGGEPGSSSQEQGSESEGPFNVLQQPPLFGNEFGQFFQASPDTNEQLRQLDWSVGFMNIKQGAMILPYHNTRATMVVLVIRGKSKSQMACPHVSRDSKEKKHEKKSVQYVKISARLSEGDVLIIPPGHPIFFVALEDENLQLVSFGVHALNNLKHFLAGSDNIWNQVPSEVKAISFKSQSAEQEEIFGSQLRAYFAPGPMRQSPQTEEEETGHSGASILDFVGFI